MSKVMISDILHKCLKAEQNYVSYYPFSVLDPIQYQPIDSYLEVPLPYPIPFQLRVCAF